MPLTEEATLHVHIHVHAMITKRMDSMNAAEDELEPQTSRTAAWNELDVNANGMCFTAENSPCDAWLLLCDCVW